MPTAPTPFAVGPIATATGIPLYVIKEALGMRLPKNPAKDLLAIAQAWGRALGGSEEEYCALVRWIELCPNWVELKKTLDKSASQLPDGSDALVLAIQKGLQFCTSAKDAKFLYGRAPPGLLKYKVFELWRHLTTQALAAAIAAGKIDELLPIIIDAPPGSIEQKVAIEKYAALKYGFKRQP